MELLGMLMLADGVLCLRITISRPQDVRVPLSPRDVIHFRHNRIERDAIGGVAVIQVERAKVVTPVAKLAKHANRALHIAAGLGTNDLTYLLAQGSTGYGIASLQVIAGKKLHGSKCPATAQDSAAIQLW